MRVLVQFHSSECDPPCEISEAEPSDLTDSSLYLRITDGDAVVIHALTLLRGIKAVYGAEEFASLVNMIGPE